jgi:hypothetical protein
MEDKAYRQSIAGYRIHRFAVEKLFGRLDGVDAFTARPYATTWPRRR